MIRLRTKPVDPVDERFEEQRLAIEDAIHKVLALEAWAIENAGALAGIIAKSAA